MITRSKAEKAAGLAFLAGVTGSLFVVMLYEWGTTHEMASLYWISPLIVCTVIFLTLSSNLIWPEKKARGKAEQQEGEGKES